MKYEVLDFWLRVLAKCGTKESKFKFQRVLEIFLKPATHCSNIQERLHLEEKKHL